ncbi:MAG: molybdenum cofactor guanylyltransferase [Planctomycetota bacterium]
MIVECGAGADAARPGGAADTPAGLVLCGGASRRFGSDKALVEHDGSTLLERTLAVLESCCGRVFLATGAEPRYAATVGDGARRRVVLDRGPDLGPLAGLEAGLRAARDAGGSPWLLVLATDLPNVTSEVLGALLDRAREALAHVCVWRDASGVHPVLAAVHVDALPAVAAALDRGERRLDAYWGDPLPGSALEPAGSRVRVVELGADVLAEAGSDPAANANTPEELLAIGRARRAQGEEARR